MSNLKLPNMSYEHLLTLAPPLNGWSQGDWKKLAYQTFVRRNKDCVEVKYFDTIIATLASDSLVLNNGGWETQTTANRLNHILYDNAPEHGRIAIRKGEMVVLDAETLKPLHRMDRLTTVARKA